MQTTCAAQEEDVGDIVLLEDIISHLTHEWNQLRHLADFVHTAFVVLTTLNHLDILVGVAKRLPE